MSRSVLSGVLLFASLSAAASATTLPVGRPLARGAMNDSATVMLARDLPGALSRSVDLGRIDDAMLLPHIRLALTRPADRQAALDKLTHDQRVRGSAAYHRWIGPLELRAYGPAQPDIDAVVGWLRARGLTVNSVSPSGMSIDFGGPAGRVAAAFHTELHNVSLHGEPHVSNVRPPAIPAPLARVVTGVTLANFFPKPMMQKASPALSLPDGPRTFYAVAPADFATIYNVNPLRTGNNFYGQPITGTGVTVALVEQTEILAGDWTRFRAAFGLSGYTGTLKQTHPGACKAPGMTGDEDEAALDTEWASAVAPDATIVEASCKGTAPYEFGVMTTLMNLVETGTSATIFSVSYGGEETANGFAFEAAWENLVQEGAAEGKSIFVSSGDSGVSVDEGSYDTLGLFVNGLADTPYNVSVGGTDFYDTALGQNAKYWHPHSSAIGGSARSYVPEIPWNNSCASSVIWNYEGGTAAIPFCNSTKGQRLQNDVGGSGGQSVYFTKPDWQLTSTLGMPNDGVRDQPDVSLFAANGVWNHFYVYCMSDPAEGGSPCYYQTPAQLFGNAAGGTSFAAPAFAGIVALLQQTFDLGAGKVVPLGNPAPEFYTIASAQFKTPLGLANCNATLGSAISPACVFNYVTDGDNAEPCLSGTTACDTSAASTLGIGVLGAKVDGKALFAYPAQPGYSLATGLGTVNVTNLLYAYY
jgi:subtilase family serine protease